jgi:hypothetical protein
MSKIQKIDAESLFSQRNEDPPVRSTLPIVRAQKFTRWLRSRIGEEAELSVRWGVHNSGVKDEIEDAAEKYGSPQHDEELPEVSSYDEVECPFTVGLTYKTTHGGVWRVEFEDDTELHVFRVPVVFHPGGDPIFCIGSAGTEAARENWSRTRELAGNSKSLLESGVYDVGLANLVEKELSEVPAIHPAAEEFYNEVDAFFEDPSSHLRFGRSGMKTWLLYGTYGTGKSTIIAEMARKQSEERAVVFVSDPSDLHTIANVAAKQDTPTIIVVSEAETVLNDSRGRAPSHESESMGASSTMLNLLDGHDQPRNEAGTALVMATNQPGRIPKRIRKRTGRINERKEIGPLSGEHAIECARLYLPTNNTVSDEVITEAVGEGLVGDDIRELAERATDEAVSCGEEDITDLHFKRAYNSLAEDLRQIQEFEFESEAHDYEPTDEVGFGQGGGGGQKFDV